MPKDRELSKKLRRKAKKKQHRDLGDAIDKNGHHALGDPPRMGQFELELLDLEAALAARRANSHEALGSLQRWLIEDATVRGLRPPAAEFLQFAAVRGLLRNDEEYDGRFKKAGRSSLPTRPSSGRARTDEGGVRGAWCLSTVWQPLARTPARRVR